MAEGCVFKGPRARRGWARRPPALLPVETMKVSGKHDVVEPYTTFCWVCPCRYFYASRIAMCGSAGAFREQPAFAKPSACFHALSQKQILERLCHMCSVLRHVTVAAQRHEALLILPSQAALLRWVFLKIKVAPHDSTRAPIILRDF